MCKDASEGRRTVHDNKCVYYLHVEYERVPEQQLINPVVSHVVR
jgi:hypothetical protein